MATIQFKGKVKSAYYVDDTLAYRYIAVPALTRTHCDMAAFRSHPKYGAYANSDLFPGMLKGIRANVFAGDKLKLDAIPEGVTVDTSGFLATVTFEA